MFMDHCMLVPRAKWTRPLSNQGRLNVDAAFFADAHVGATAAVLRDDKGRFVAGSCAYLDNIESAATAEALAMKNGLELAVSSGCNMVRAESNVLIEVINACYGKSMWWSSAAAIYANCVTSIWVIGKVECRHFSRESNEVAHSCSNEVARSCFDSRILIIGLMRPLVAF